MNKRKEKARRKELIDKYYSERKILPGQKQSQVFKNGLGNIVTAPLGRRSSAEEAYDEYIRMMESRDRLRQASERLRRSNISFTVDSGTLTWSA